MSRCQNPYSPRLPSSQPRRPYQLLARELVQRQLELAPIAAAHRRPARRPRTPSRSPPRPGAGSSAPATACRGGRRSAPGATPGSTPTPPGLSPPGRGRGRAASGRTPPHTAGCRPPARAAAAASSAGRTRPGRAGAETSWAVSASESGGEADRRRVSQPRAPRPDASRTAPVARCRRGAAARPRTSRPDARGRRAAPRPPSAGPRTRAPSAAPPRPFQEAPPGRERLLLRPPARRLDPDQRRQPRAAATAGPARLGERPPPASVAAIRASRTRGCPPAPCTISPSAQNVIPSP